MSDAITEIPVARIDGTPATLGDYAGKVLLVVNVASKCGLTPQYTGLQALYEAKHGAGLEVLGFPANNFGAQEPGTEAEIVDFCSTTYNVTFPMFQKISVAGADKHPLYAALVEAKPEAEGTETFRGMLANYGVPPSPASEVLWNFEKFVIGKDGKVLARLSPDVAADDPRLTSVIDAALKA